MNTQNNNRKPNRNSRSYHGRPNGSRRPTERTGGTDRGQQKDGSPSRPKTGATSRKPSGKKGPAKRSGRGRSRMANQRRRGTNPSLQHRITTTDEKNGVVIPEVTSEDVVRVIPISGVEEIGRNMIVFETKDDIVVVDAGFQFVSEESNAPGINYILPNTQYLEERKHKIRALVVTHGHLDHIGGIPFIMERIGNPPIYTQYLTSLMIAKRQEEFPHLDPVDMHVVKEGESFTVGKTKVKTFPVTHSIPDAMGIAFETKHGDVVVTGDIRLTHEDGEVDKEERESWESVGKNNNLLMLADSTNADREGFSAPESMVFEALENIIKNATGRLIIGTFASQFERLIHVIKMCEKYGKFVVPEGRSIKSHIDIALMAKMMEVKPGVIISGQEIEDHPSDRIVVLATGAQGEEFAALMRMATDKHKYITLNERDTLVLSSSVIPGNEIAVQKLKDNIYRKNVRVINYKSASVHSSGHGNAGELNWVRQRVNPKFLVPVHGHHFHLKSHMYSAIENGFNRENIVVPDNGSIIEIENGEKISVRQEKAPTELLMVDGFTVGARQEVVLRDRQSLANDGMFVIIATVNTKNGKLRKSPDIISRGFVYLRENQQLLSEARILIKKTVEKHTDRMHPLDLDFVKDELTDVMSGFLMQKTQKTPMVIPVLIGI
ncbi:ribonuclease J [Candidatus Nomurabacteria bacterium]|nr:ribonuclease J [Candidatus Nomurabacteria bacterium]